MFVNCVQTCAINSLQTMDKIIPFIHCMEAFDDPMKAVVTVSGTVYVMVAWRCKKVVSQVQICVDSFPIWCTEIEVGYQTCYLTHSQCTDTRQTSPCSDLKAPGMWQGSHLRTTLWVTGMR